MNFDNWEASWETILMNWHEDSQNEDETANELEINIGDAMHYANIDDEY